MKKTFISVIAAIIIAIGAVTIVGGSSGSSYVAKNAEAADGTASFYALKTDYLNSETFTVTVDGETAYVSPGDIYYSEDGYVMISEDLARSAFGCAVNLYGDSTVIIIKGSVVLKTSTGSASVEVDGNIIEPGGSISIVEDTLYIPETFFTQGLGFSGAADSLALTAQYTTANEKLNILPEKYSSEDYGRLPSVKDQGDFGACWAYAAISALEAGLLPEEESELSALHLIYNHGFGNDGTTSGDQGMSVGYLLSWAGPVYEEEGSAACHVQEVTYIPDKDYDAIKEAVMEYGAVECSVYIDTISNLYVNFTYYNYYQNAYCYNEEGASPNHEIIIIGWDDTYPAENFNGGVSSDGAFICLNSWGSGFGNEGVFYVSYEDTLIGTSNLVYSGIEDADNYDNIYQYDEVGWTADIGYDRNTSYMANVYTAQGDENLEAVGFYATGDNTRYKVYVVTDYQGEKSLIAKGKCIAEGSLAYKGFYTVEFGQGIDLTAGQDYAVIVEINTAGDGKPIACEMNTGTERTSTITTDNKYSYISCYGDSWERTQETLNCNVCLKAYTSAD